MSTQTLAPLTTREQRLVEALEACKEEFEDRYDPTPLDENRKSPDLWMGHLMLQIEDVLCPRVAINPPKPEPVEISVHEYVVGYWFLVSAFEHVNGNAAPLRDATLSALSDARCSVLSELPDWMAMQLIQDSAHHEAIADRRRHLMQIKGGE